MGLFTKLGEKVGSELGGKVGKYFGGKRGVGVGRSIGGEIGSIAGTVLPTLAFKQGGRVPGKRGRPRKAIVHGGEYILPVGIKPTMAQKKMVAKIKGKKK